MTVSIKDILKLEQLDTNLFRNLHHCENYRQTLYGGQVLCQALNACFQTVEDRLPNSLHAYFLRPGSSEQSVIYDVESVRDGGSFSSRRCVARQFGRPIFNLSASFHMEEEGYAHQEAFPADIPSPSAVIEKGVTGFFKIAEFGKGGAADPFELLPIKTATTDNGISETYFWLKCKETLPEDPIYHYGTLAFASDLGLIATALKPHDPKAFQGGVLAASIDHAMWFHASDFKCDQWLLCKNSSPWAGNARGFTRASIFDQNQRLVASTAQEGLIRPI